MNDLTLNHNKATLTIDENEGGIVVKIFEFETVLVKSTAQIWLDQRGIARLYAFLRDVMPDSDEGLNGEEIY